MVYMLVTYQVNFGSSCLVLYWSICQRVSCRDDVFLLRENSKVDLDLELRVLLIYQPDWGPGVSPRQVVRGGIGRDSFLCFLVFFLSFCSFGSIIVVGIHASMFKCKRSSCLNVHPMHECCLHTNLSQAPILLCMVGVHASNFKCKGHHAETMG